MMITISDPDTRITTTFLTPLTSLTIAPPSVSIEIDSGFTNTRLCPSGCVGSVASGVGCDAAAFTAISRMDYRPSVVWPVSAAWLAKQIDVELEEAGQKGMSRKTIRQRLEDLGLLPRVSQSDPPAKRSRIGLIFARAIKYSKGTHLPQGEAPEIYFSSKAASQIQMARVTFYR